MSNEPSHSPLSHHTWQPLRERCGLLAPANKTVLNSPLRWNNAGRCRVLIQGDLFSGSSGAHVPAAVRAAIFRIIDRCANVRWIMPTGHIEQVHRHWPGICHDEDLGDDGVTMAVHRPNVALLARCHNQQSLETAIKPLLACRDFVPTLGLYFESLAGPVDIFSADGNAGCLLDWIVLRGGSRPMHPCVVRGIRDQCLAAGVPFWFDTWGAWRPRLAGIAGRPAPIASGSNWGMLDASGAWWPRTTPWNGQQDSDSERGEVVMVGTGREKSGREIDGKTWSQLPEGFR